MRRRTRDEGGETIKETVYIGSLYEVDDSGIITKHIFAGSNRVCSLKSDATAAYYHSDHLGSSNVITDENGNQVGSYEYQPYGKTSRETTDEGRGTNYLYTGKELDQVGLYYYGARYYDPVIGRFIQPDTIVQAPFDPQTLNRYTYCRNNPLKYVDPSGHFFGIIAAIVIGAAVGGAIAAVTGGDIGMGLLTGAIGGLFFGVAGSIIESMKLQGLAAAGTHFAAGAASGALGAVATGGDPGMGALLGGASAGASYWLGHNVPWLEAVEGDYFGNVTRRAATGALVGGGISAAMGGSFGRGAQYGATTAAIAYTANEVLHEAVKRIRNALNTDQSSKTIEQTKEVFVTGRHKKVRTTRIGGRGDTFLKIGKAIGLLAGVPTMSVQIGVKYNFDVYDQWAQYNVFREIDMSTYTSEIIGKSKIYGTEYWVYSHTEVGTVDEVMGVPIIIDTIK